MDPRPILLWCGNVGSERDGDPQKGFSGAGGYGSRPKPNREVPSRRCSCATTRSKRPTSDRAHPASDLVHRYLGAGPNGATTRPDEASHLDRGHHCHGGTRGGHPRRALPHRPVQAGHRHNGRRQSGIAVRARTDLRPHQYRWSRGLAHELRQHRACTPHGAARGSPSHPGGGRSRPTGAPRLHRPGPACCSHSRSDRFLRGEYFPRYGGRVEPRRVRRGPRRLCRSRALLRPRRLRVRGGGSRGGAAHRKQSGRRRNRDRLPRRVLSIAQRGGTLPQRRG
ncbi:hypothetical protein BH23ACT5_BH23ACT5_22280 [soil metagenome]